MAVSTKRRQASSSAAEDYSPSPSPPPSRPTKKANRASSSSGFAGIFEASATSQHDAAAASLPARKHTASYHRPLLLDQPDTVRSLLTWFQAVSAKRDMPWRAPYVDACDYTVASELGEVRKKRAYQVWISEIMLQQTRVETVKSYWLAWMSKWPTIQELAAAAEDEVLASWRGLGYYSRATRIHTAAKKVVDEYDGLLPASPVELQKHVPGVGPYTAGAISSIVFGQPVPILDGNVVRVLSRQLALYASPKAKVTTDLLWAAADVLVKKAYQLGGEKGAVPGEWNQALMELGSTVCTPLKPGCGGCPIQQSCRALHEAQADIANGKKTHEIADIEDLCDFCEPFPFEEELIDSSNIKPEKAADKGVKKMRQATLAFGFAASSSGKSHANGKAQREQAAESEKTIERHVGKYPMKLEKKKIRQEECLVCIIERAEHEYLLERRPSTGLLASMWQFPSLTISTTAVGPSDEPQDAFPSTPLSKLVDTFVASLVDLPVTKAATLDKQNIGSITHMFSHLHLTMHVYKATLPEDTPKAPDASANRTNKKKAAGAAETETEKNKHFGSRLGDNAPRRWASADEVDAETMGTGMRNCWIALQQQSNAPSRAKAKGNK